MIESGGIKLDISGLDGFLQPGEVEATSSRVAADPAPVRNTWAGLICPNASPMPN